jgi:hypothetical protein
VLYAAGAYCGTVEDLVSLGVGSRITIRLGEAHIRVCENRLHCARGTRCRLDIDPEAIQVWPRE